MGARVRQSIEATSARRYALYGSGYQARRAMLAEIVRLHAPDEALFDVAQASGPVRPDVFMTTTAGGVLVLAGLAHVVYTDCGPQLHPTSDGVTAARQFARHTPHRGALLRRTPAGGNRSAHGARGAVN